MIWYIHHVPVHCVPVHVTPRPNEVTHSKCWGVRQHSPTPLKNPSILRQNLLHVKQPSKQRHIWPQATFYIRHLSLKYKYKDRARISEQKSPTKPPEKLPQRQQQNSNFQHTLHMLKPVPEHSNHRRIEIPVMFYNSHFSHHDDSQTSAYGCVMDNLTIRRFIRWMASLRETIHPGQVSLLACRQTLNRNPKGAPAIQHLTNSETASAARF